MKFASCNTNYIKLKIMNIWPDILYDDDDDEEILEFMNYGHGPYTVWERINHMMK